MLEFRTTTQNFSPAILELDAAMRAGRLRHDGNPVLEWCLGNVVGKADRRGNLYPAKQRAADQAAGGAEDRRRRGADDGGRPRHGSR
jgi:phage terminase large subunit-like protein